MSDSPCHFAGRLRTLIITKCVKGVNGSAANISSNGAVYMVRVSAYIYARVRCPLKASRLARTSSCPITCPGPKRNGQFKSVRRLCWKHSLDKISWNASAYFCQVWLSVWPVIMKLQKCVKCGMFLTNYIIYVQSLLFQLFRHKYCKPY